VFISEPDRQLSCWYNDMDGDASVWVILFNGKHAGNEILVSKEGLVGIKVEDTICISWYCSPNVSKQDFDGYIGELEEVIRDSRRRAPALIVAGNFNAKSMTWGGIRTEPRGTYLLDMITRNELMPIRMTGKHSFVRNGSTSFPDILSVNRQMRQSWKKSLVMDWYSASDHLYILHEFVRNRNRQARGSFKFSTKNMDVNKFLNKLDEYLDIMVSDKAAHGVQF
jgi:hypothetical protein